MPRVKESDRDTGLVKLSQQDKDLIADALLVKAATHKSNARLFDMTGVQGRARRGAKVQKELANRYFALALRIKGRV